MRIDNYEITADNVTAILDVGKKLKDEAKEDIIDVIKTVKGE